MKSDRKALEEAIALIDSPERWTTEVYARDELGRAVHSTSPKAQKWCALGALEVACEQHVEQMCRITFALMLALPQRMDISVFNDSHSYDEVMLTLKQGLDRVTDEPQ